MSAKAKRRRVAARAEARRVLDPEKKDAALMRKLEIWRAEEVRLRKALEDGTATDEEKEKDRLGREDSARWWRLHEDLKTAGQIGILDLDDYDEYRDCVDSWLLQKRLKERAVACAGPCRVDVEMDDWWDFGIFVYFQTDEELAASALGDLRLEIELEFLSELENAKTAPPHARVRFAYGSHEEVMRDCKRDYEYHRYVSILGKGYGKTEKKRGPGRWSGG